MFSQVSVCPWDGVGIFGPMSFLGRGWVSLVPGPFYTRGTSREVGMLGAGTCSYMGPGLLQVTVDKSAVRILLKCFLVSIATTGKGV